MKKPVLVLLHGMFGEADDWRDCAELLARHWEVRVPELPVWEMPSADTGVSGLVTYIEQFLDRERIDRAVLAGNSMGGQIVLEVALRRPEQTAALVLVGSSGLSERGFEGKPQRRPTREWVRARIREIFFEERHVTDALVERIHDTVSDRRRAMQIVHMAKSVKQSDMRDVLHRIQCPVLLVWGAQDNITPPDTAREFKKYIPHAELEFISRCGHSPNIERPQEISVIMEGFLERHCAAPIAG